MKSQIYIYIYSCGYQAYHADAGDISKPCTCAAARCVFCRASDTNAEYRELLRVLLSERLWWLLQPAATRFVPVGCEAVNLLPQSTPVEVGSWTSTPQGPDILRLSVNS